MFRAGLLSTSEPTLRRFTYTCSRCLALDPPGLLIPWEELTANAPDGGSPRYLEFRFRAVPSVFLRISKGLGVAILAQRPNHPPI